MLLVTLLGLQVDFRFIGALERMRILQLKEHIESFLLNDAVLRLSCVETNNQALGRAAPSTLDCVNFLQNQKQLSLNLVNIYSKVEY